jgi:hypothetical protein
MADRRWFFVSYEGELDRHDRSALTRPGWTLYVNGTGTWAAHPPADVPRQVVRLEAESEEAAGRLVASALGRRPGNLQVIPARPVAAATDAFAYLARVRLIGSPEGSTGTVVDFSGSRSKAAAWVRVRWDTGAELRFAPEALEPIEE